MEEPIFDRQREKLGNYEEPRTDVADDLDLARFTFPKTFNSEQELAKCMRSHEITVVT